MAGAARVFISYSTQNASLVERLKDDLKRAGVNVWLDHEQLKPGTPNWQAAVLKGIEQATTVIYAASETAAKSEYVTHELAIARGEGKTILPFWIHGEKWYFSVPMGFYLAQYVDGRDAAYAAGLAALLGSLGATAATSAPPALALPRYPLPDVPARLASLGFYGFNMNGTPAILPPLVSVAAGPFLMGSAESDKDARDDEKPQHPVELAAFQIGKYPVTVAEYALAVRAGAVREAAASEIKFGDAILDLAVTWRQQLQHPDHPVVAVSWQDATAYVAWLRQVTGEVGWRLPSEAQWEKAARWDAQRGVSRLYPWGDSFDKVRCNTSESGIGTTTPVGSYPASDARRSGASPCGAEEMVGNVWEWTNSVFKSYPYIESDGREDQNSTHSRSLRGGSWSNNAGNARAAYRYDGGWDNLYSGRGFRLALAASRAGS